jgi:hypothetical protein
LYVSLGFSSLAQKQGKAAEDQRVQGLLWTKEGKGSAQRETGSLHRRLIDYRSVAKKNK